ncbi:MAG: 2-oxoacid:ferredoxin oxidoreductase subunit beta [SAR324 cluster bacterium]|uniref:2-oxoacid:ferredoxin oxidoreductase subunit beta n=1 Tax=SAR324 cluster bacterium TaxID=2024889 RepID=A0A2A4SW48_9DELT|nr:MAG: 2-oxoacid:ferredoxin oxidoreductase subunit beta [SAR324 cluster bacterium]
MNTQAKKYTKKDFVSNQEVKWCSGCGDFSILSQTQKVLSEIGRPPEEITFVSGIGCSSRFTYYMDTYGFHTIHGRALAVATGVKTQNPDLSVWVAFGDGDGMSIGGNHFIHTIRRNLDIVCIMMDNRIYGLTKGQYSPTSLRDQITKTSPFGKLEAPMDPVAMALSSGATFVARSTDRNPKHLNEVLHKAYQHKGFSFVHVLQNCVIFNDGCHEPYVGKEKADNTLMLKDGQPMIFGKENDKAIVRDGFDPKVVNVADVDASEILVHDENSSSQGQSYFLAQMSEGKFPMPMGVIRQVEEPTYDGAYTEQIAEITAKQGQGDLQELLDSGDTWTVE